MSDDLQDRVNEVRGEIEPILDLLTEVWDKFLCLPRVHPDHVSEFRFHFHELQRLLGIRLARVVCPDLWSEPSRMLSEKEQEILLGAVGEGATLRTRGSDSEVMAGLVKLIGRSKGDSDEDC